MRTFAFFFSKLASCEFLKYGLSKLDVIFVI
jgi:hypothetical protein